MIITNNENEIYMAWRNESGDRESKTVTTQPYFFVARNLKEPNEYKIGSLYIFIIVSNLLKLIQRFIALIIIKITFLSEFL